MDYGIENVASGLSNLNENYQVVANNLANANSTGYKREMAVFQQALAAHISSQSNYAAVSSGSPVDASSGGPSAPPMVSSQIKIDYSQGEINQTGRKLDVAVVGKGFMAVEIENVGTRYTRNGQFEVSKNGQIINLHGQLVAGEGGPLTIPNNISSENIQIMSDGTLMSGNERLGKLRIVEFQDASKLTPVGDGLYAAGTDATEVTPVKTKVMQGYLESSNVKIMDELVSLIMITRLYEANTKSITQMDERLRNLLNVTA